MLEGVNNQPTAEMSFQEQGVFYLPEPSASFSFNLQSKAVDLLEHSNLNGDGTSKKSTGRICR
jgi:hypothetical protein